MEEQIKQMIAQCVQSQDPQMALQIVNAMAQQMGIGQAPPMEGQQAAAAPGQEEARPGKRRMLYRIGGKLTFKPKE